MSFPNALSRRQVLRGSLAALAATNLASLGTRRLLEVARADEDSEPANWIDAHVHVWTPDVQRYPLDAAYSVADMQPPSFTPEELFTHCRPSGVQRVVLIQMSYYQTDNSYMTDVIAQYPGVFSGVGIVDHQAANLVERIGQLYQQGVRGFRIHATGEEARKWLADPGMQTLWRTAQSRGMAVCPLINPTDIPVVDALCAKHPETRVVVDHFARIGVSGRIEQEYLTQLCRLARYPNVFVKTSAFYALGAKKAPYHDLIPMIKQVRDHFGAERLMWASDCPYQVQGDYDYESAIALIRDGDFLSRDEKDWLLRKTAEKVYFS